MVVLMSIWTGHFMGGFTGQSNPKLEFNWHPLLLTISLVYLYGNGILIYRLGRNERKNRLKVAHATGKSLESRLERFKSVLVKSKQLSQDRSSKDMRSQIGTGQVKLG